MPPKPPAPTTRLRHAKKAAWRKVADEAVILDCETAHYFSLEGCGRRAWELLDGRSPDEAAGVLAGEYDAPDGAIRRDVRELAARLWAEGLLEPA